MKKLTIGLVSPYDFNVHGGVQEHSNNLGKSLSELGHKVIFFSPSEESLAIPQPHINIGYGVRLPTFNGSWAELSFSQTSSKEIKKILQDNKIDILHFQELLVPFASWSWIKHSSAINIVTFHTSWEVDSTKQGPFSIYAQFVKSKVFNYISKTVAVSPLAKNCNQSLLKNNTVIPPAIDITSIQKKQNKPQPLNQPGNHLLFVGRLDERKGTHHLIKALHKMPKNIIDNTTLHIVGSGPGKSHLQTLIKRYQLIDRVIFHGAFSQDLKYAFMQHADLFIAPTTHGESFGMVLIEALAAGCPVIAGNNEGYATTLANYPYQEYILDPTKYKDFAEKITALLKNKTHQKEIKKWAATFVLQFDSMQVAKEHEKIYYEVIKEM